MRLSGDVDSANIAHDVAVDSSNNTVVVGVFDATITVGRFRLSAQYPSVFVVKQAPSGEVLWALQVFFLVLFLFVVTKHIFLNANTHSHTHSHTTVYFQQCSSQRAICCVCVLGCYKSD